MADSLVGQGNIGTLVKSEVGSDDATVCGLLTALNLRQFAHQSWPKMIACALIAKAKKHADADVVSRLEATLQRPDRKTGEVGLLLSERFANLPPALIPPLHKALRDDIDWSCKTPECPEDERPYYRFKHFVGVVRCFDNVAGAASVGRKKRKAGTPAPAAPAGELEFPQAEHGVYFRRATISFSFPMPTSDSGGPKGRGRPERRAVFVLTRRALDEAEDEIDKAMSAASEA